VTPFTRVKVTVWTPTDASWLNLIEAHFGALKRFMLAKHR